MNEQFERIIGIFTEEDKEFNARMVEEGMKIKEKRITVIQNKENDDYDVTSDVLNKY